MFKVCNVVGDMILLSVFVIIECSFGFDWVMYYNGFFLVDISGGLVLGYLFGQVIVVIEKIVSELLFDGMIYEWMDLIFQEK